MDIPHDGEWVKAAGEAMEDALVGVVL